MKKKDLKAKKKDLKAKKKDPKVKKKDLNPFPVIFPISETVFGLFRSWDLL